MTEVSPDIMDKLIGYDQGVFDVIEWRDVQFEGYGSAYIAISKCGGKFRLEANETQPPKGLTREQVNNWVYDNYNVYDPRIKRKEAENE